MVDEPTTYEGLYNPGNPTTPINNSSAWFGMTEPRPEHLSDDAERAVKALYAVAYEIKTTREAIRISAGMVSAALNGITIAAYVMIALLAIALVRWWS